MTRQEAFAEVKAGHRGSGKGNELAAIRALLDALVLKGCIVTRDALGCQTAIAEKIVSQGGDYVWAVKDNQGNLSAAMVDFFATAEALNDRSIDGQQQVWTEKDHGRLETRRATLVVDVSWMDQAMREDWEHLGGVGIIETEQDIQGKVSIERRHFILSRGVKTVEAFAAAVRPHWRVESMHRVLDVTFRDDDCCVRKGHAAGNLSAIRKFALTAFARDKLHPERSLRRRLNLADRRPDDRGKLPGLRPRQSNIPRQCRLCKRLL
jgi:predicted transposase YbfD/YdcC